MKDETPVSPTPSLPSDPRWELVRRVAASTCFRPGTKLHAFLLHACENALLERHENLTAQVIGSRIFGRDPTYNLSEDNIVRVEARELRKRLTAYFEGEGRNEPLVIEIPKGSYIPVFKPREQAGMEAPLNESLPSETAAPARAVRQPARWVVPALAAALLVAVGIIVWQALDNPMRQQKRVFLAGIRPSSSSDDFSFYADMLGTLGSLPNRDTLLVLSNPAVLLYYGSNSTVPEPATEVAIPAPPEVVQTFGFVLRSWGRTAPFRFLQAKPHTYTGTAEATAAFHVGRLMQLLGRRVFLTQSRFLNWAQVPKQDLILLGGPQSNDWTFQEDANSNFTFSARGLENLKPQSGEQRLYRIERPQMAGRQATIDYGVVKMVTTPYGFRVLLLGGLGTSATAAAGEFLAMPGKMGAVYRKMREASGGKPFPAAWEIVIRATARDDLPVDSAAVAFRPR